jgi:hypothetical protein
MTDPPESPDGRCLHGNRRTGKKLDRRRKPGLMDHELPAPRIPAEPPPYPIEAVPVDAAAVALLIPEPRRSAENRLY